MIGLWKKGKGKKPSDGNDVYAHAAAGLTRAFWTINRWKLELSWRYMYIHLRATNTGERRSTTRPYFRAYFNPETAFSIRRSTLTVLDPTLRGPSSAEQERYYHPSGPSHECRFPSTANGCGGQCATIGTTRNGLIAGVLGQLKGHRRVIAMPLGWQKYRLTKWYQTITDTTALPAIFVITDANGTRRPPTRTGMSANCSSRLCVDREAICSLYTKVYLLYLR